MPEETVQNDLDHAIDEFESEIGIADLLATYDRIEVEYARLARSEEPVVSYSINSQPMTQGRIIAPSR